MLKNQLLVVYPLALLVGLGFSQVIKASSNVDSNSSSYQTRFQIHPQADCQHGCFSATEVKASPAQPLSPPPPPPSDDENDNFDNEQDFYQDQNNPDHYDNGDYYDHDLNPDNNDHDVDNDHDNDNGYNGGNETPNPG